MIAEAAIISTGGYAVATWGYLGLRGLPYNASFYVIVLSSIIAGMVLVTRFIWLRREKLSGGAYGAGLVLCCYSWLQLVVPWMGFGWGIIRFTVLEVLLLVSVWLILSGEKGTSSLSTEPELQTNVEDAVQDEDAMVPRAALPGIRPLSTSRR